MSNQKMREALQAAYEAHQDDFDQPWLSLAAEALAAPAGEQVGLTDQEMVNAYESEQQGRWGDHIRSLQAVIAADRAARAEPIAWATPAGIAAIHAARLGRADNVQVPLSTYPGGDHSVAVYTAPPAAPVVPEGWGPILDAAIAAERAARAEPVDRWEAGFRSIVTIVHGARKTFEISEIVEKVRALSAPPAAPVVPNEEGKHCGDPDCVPCRDPAEPAGEQVGLTDAEVKEHFHHGSRTCKVSGPMNARDLAGIRQVIAAHEAKRSSCSQTAEKSTCEVGRVDETGKSEHVWGAS